MTTKVTVYALHGWPVDVTAVKTGSVTPIYSNGPERVSAGAQRDFHVWAGQDLLIHEVQPSEIAAPVAEKEIP